MEHDIPSLNLPKDVEGKAWEARARISWGDAPEEVHNELLGMGIDSQTADRILAVCIRERDTSVRKKGIRDLLTGGFILAIAAGVLIGIQPFMSWLAQFIPVSAKAGGLVVGVCVLGTLFGGHLALRGFDRLVKGARMKGSDSDIEDTL